MNNVDKGLRIAIVARVSTEAQEARGESLRAQVTQMRAAVHQLGAIVVEPPYSGQEHATPGYERKLLKRLLADAVRGAFDAVMVTDYYRWSRGNEEAEAALDILLQHNVRFFALTREEDLEDEDTRFMLGVRSGMNKAAARKTRKLSARSRITRAIRGHVSSSFPPFGRFVKNADRSSIEAAQWEVDKEAQRSLVRA